MPKFSMLKDIFEVIAVLFLLFSMVVALYFMLVGPYTFFQLMGCAIYITIAMGFLNFITNKY